MSLRPDITSEEDISGFYETLAAGWTGAETVCRPLDPRKNKRIFHTNRALAWLPSQLHGRQPFVLYRAHGAASHLNPN